MSALLDRLGIELPVLQAGMGGGIAGHRLAAAVSEAGGLGTLGISQPDALRGELATARKLTGAPIAINLLLPFARRRHWEVAAEADCVITFWGKPRRQTDRIWIHQCGSLEEALAAATAGADAVIAQGVEAGGHVRGKAPALELLAAVRDALPELPAILAGGIAGPADVREALDAGAAAVACGTRFLLSEESGAHPAYKQRCLEAERTILTELFGLGWPAPHRVIANRATGRWLDPDGRPPAGVRTLNRITAPLASRLPVGIAARLASTQRPALPLYGPQPPLAGAPERSIEAMPLYAGETVARIADLRSASELTRELGGT